MRSTLLALLFSLSFAPLTSAQTSTTSAIGSGATSLDHGKVSLSYGPQLASAVAAYERINGELQLVPPAQFGAGYALQLGLLPDSTGHDHFSIAVEMLTMLGASQGQSFGLTFAPAVVFGLPTLPGNPSVGFAWRVYSVGDGPATGAFIKPDVTQFLFLASAGVAELLQSAGVVVP